MNRKTKLLFFITEDWFFCSHFIDRAVAAREAGYEVAVVCRVNQHSKVIEDCGIRVIPLKMERKSINPLRDLFFLFNLIRIYRRERPQIVQHIALKPILYGTLVALLTGIPRIVNAPVGMGYVFSSRQWKARLLRPLIMQAYRGLMNPRNGVTVFENPDDQDFLVGLKIVDPARTRLIRGAGVNMQRFHPTPEPDGPVLVLLAARMLWDKGVGEFVEAARLLRHDKLNARFVIAGAPDQDNPAAIPQSQLEAWQNEGCVEWWGHQSNMPAVLGKTHVFCLPTAYAEGLPKALIEAAAAGRAIVTTDAPGCREVVRNGENGFLIPLRSSHALANALRQLIENSELRKRMGQRGREIAVAEFSNERICEETLSLYQALVSPQSADAADASFR